MPLPHWINRWSRRLILPAVIAAGIFLPYYLLPPYSLDPFCTYDVTYRLSATIDFAGKQYSSQVVHQESRSRHWVSGMNSAGCQQTYGTALSFRLDDGRVILASSGICPAARKKFIKAQPIGAYGAPPVDGDDARPYYAKAMSEHQTVDVKQSCSGITLDRHTQRTTDGFLIDSAERPATWYAFEFDSAMFDRDATVRLVSAVATANDAFPYDDLEGVAPAILKTNFKYSSWWDSPERLLSFHRRYNPDNRFQFEAQPYSPH